MGHGKAIASSPLDQPRECPMPQSNDLSRCLIPFRQDETLVAVVEMSKTSWLVAGMIPGVARHPLKKLVPDEKALFELLERWRDEAVKAGKIITRITVAYEAGRDGFWLARWLRARGFEVYVVHSSSVAVTREHRRAKTDRLDCEMLKRVFIGWLRGERDHCRMVAIATQTQEDAKRPNRERENLVGECTRIVGRLKAGLARLGIRSFNPKLRNAAERLEFAAYAGGRAGASEHALRVAPRHGAPSVRQGPDQTDRAGPRASAGTGARARSPTNGASLGPCARHRNRDGGYAGA